MKEYGHEGIISECQVIHDARKSPWETAWTLKKPSVRLSKSKVYLLILLGSGPPPPASSPAVKRLPRGSRFVVEFVFPLPFPLLSPFVGIAERPIPVETRLKPDPPGL